MPKVFHGFSLNKYDGISATLLRGEELHRLRRRRIDKRKKAKREGKKKL